MGARDRTPSAWRGGLVQKNGGYTRSAKCGQHAGSEYAAETGMVGEVAESRRPEPKCHVEKRRVGPDREPPVLRGHKPDGLDAEPGIDQGIAEPRQGSPGKCEREVGRKPDQSEACRFD